MKYLPAQIAYFVQTGTTRRNLRLLVKFFVALVVMVGAYSVAFHLLMAREGQDYSWLTGIYWTLTVMSTLGFGDITFESDAGRAFSILVLLSGIIFLLVVLPFTFIQFFYAPWLEATSRQRAPRQVPHDMRDHVILTNRDAVSLAFIERLRYHGRQYYVLEPNLVRALEMHDDGLSVMLGAPDDIDTYRHVRAPDAALIAATGDDHSNTNMVGNAADLAVLESAGIREAPSTIVTTNDDATNIYLTIYCRRLRPDMQIISRATLERNISTLHRAGADFVMSYASMGANTIYNLLEGGDVVMLAEGLDVFRCPVPRSLAGRTLVETNIRSRTGCSVVAIEQDGRVVINPPPDSALPDSSTAELILIGTTQGERRFLERYGDKT